MTDTIKTINDFLRICYVENENRTALEREIAISLYNFYRPRKHLEFITRGKDLEFYIYYCNCSHNKRSEGEFYNEFKEDIHKLIYDLDPFYVSRFHEGVMQEQWAFQTICQQIVEEWNEHHRPILVGTDNLTIHPNAELILNQEDVIIALERHQCGDWGATGGEDSKFNDLSLIAREKLISVYNDRDNNNFYVVTEYGHEKTSVILVDDYLKEALPALLPKPSDSAEFRFPDLVTYDSQGIFKMSTLDLADKDFAQNGVIPMDEIFITKNAYSRINHEDALTALKRFLNGDWGHIFSEHAELNDNLITNGLWEPADGGIIGLYHDRNGNEFLITSMHEAQFHYIQLRHEIYYIEEEMI